MSFKISQFFLLFIIAIKLLATDTVNLPNNYEVLSDYWPKFVHLKQPYDLTDSKTVKKGYRGAFIRTDSNKLIVDYGGFGIHRMDINHVDFLEQFNHSLNKGKKNKSLFFEIMFNKFFKSYEKNWVQCGQSDFIDTEYAIFVFLDFSDPKNNRKIKHLLNLKERLASDNISVIAMSLDSTEKSFLSALKDVKWAFNACYHWSTKAYAKTYQLDYHENKFFLIDRNGKLISSGNNLQFIDSIFGDIIKNEKLVKTYQMNFLD